MIGFSVEGKKWKEEETDENENITGIREEKDRVQVIMIIKNQSITHDPDTKWFR